MHWMTYSVPKHDRPDTQNGTSFVASFEKRFVSLILQFPLTNFSKSYREKPKAQVQLKGRGLEIVHSYQKPSQVPWDYKIINHWTFIIFADRGLTFKTTLMGLKQASLSLQACCQFYQRASNWGLNNCQITTAAYGCMSQLLLLFGFKSNLLGVPTPIWIFGWLYLLQNQWYTCDRHSETILVTFTTWLWPQGCPLVTMT